MPRSTPRRTPPAIVLALALLAALASLAACGTSGGDSDDARPLKIGVLMDFTDGSAEVARDRRRGAELAVKHVNDADGVFGLPVQIAVRDTTRDPQVGVEAARRLIEDDGVHAIVGPNTSANAMAIAEEVIGPARVPTVSFSATSPMLTDAADDDFLFRTALSDKAQGPALAQLARERGFDSVGVIYVDDAYGEGLARAFLDAWGDSAVRSASFDPDQTEFASALRETAGAGALVVIAFETAAVNIVRQALDGGIYDSFIFCDAAKREGIVKGIGGARLGGMYGIGPGRAPDNESSKAWSAAYAAEYGELTARPYVREAYDAAMALALAAQAAGDADGTAIRDQLRAIGAAPGSQVIADPESIAEGLRVLQEGGEVDYEGAATTLDWDENGDLLRGYVGVWRFTEDERIEDLNSMPFEFAP